MGFWRIKCAALTYKVIRRRATDISPNTGHHHKRFLADTGGLAARVTEGAEVGSDIKQTAAMIGDQLTAQKRQTT
jgi:hypothetical protein